MSDPKGPTLPSGRRLPGAPPPAGPTAEPGGPSSTTAPTTAASRPGVAAPPRAVTPGAPSDEARLVRAVAAGGTALAAGVLVAAGVVLLWFAPPRPVVDPTAVAATGLPPETIAALAELRDEVAAPVEITRIAPPPPPRPADVLIHLPPGHAFRRWAMYCTSSSFTPPVTEAPISREETTVRIPLVPPVRCDVSLAGPGAPTLRVRAGSVVTCRDQGVFVCDD